MWLPLRSVEEIQSFLTAVGGFHDGALREFAVSTETYVAADLSTACPDHLDTWARIHLQRQYQDPAAFELLCRGVSHLQFTPTLDGCNSIVFSGDLRVEDSAFRLTLEYLNSPMRPPTQEMLARIAAAPPPGLTLLAQSIEWRPIELTGDRLLYVAPQRR